jgi:hypothetical protein
MHFLKMRWELYFQWYKYYVLRAVLRLDQTKPGRKTHGIIARHHWACAAPASHLVIGNAKGRLEQILFMILRIFREF